MKKDSIFQFVCFITNLGQDEFLPKWEHYAKRFMNKKTEPALHQQQQVNGIKNRYQYISQHEWPDQDFQFSFMDERRSEHFPEHNVKVVQTGGYVRNLSEKREPEEDGDVKLISFIGHNENDIDFYRRLSHYHLLNIYQAFYESCSYGYVLEYFVPEKNAEELMQQIKQRPGTETGIYRACLVPHI
jgi:hypothetical protein